MGYCVDFKGRFYTDTPMSPEHVAALRKLEDTEEGYPGAPPDDRFNPWCVTKDSAGFEVLTDKPGEWKSWLQYLIDEFLTPWGYVLSGSVEWSGGRGDAGTITIENRKVKARHPKPSKAWADIDPKARAHVGEQMAEAMQDDRRGSDEAWLAAMHALGVPPTSDRTEFDD